MASIKFFIQTDKNPAGIYVRLLEGRGVDAKAKTKFVVNPDDWSKTKGKPKNLKNEDLKKLNIELDTFHSNLINFYNTRVNIDPINSDWLKEFIEPKNRKEIPSLLVEYVDYYLEDRKGEIKKRVIQQAKTVKLSLIAFEKKQRKKYLVADFNRNFSKEYEAYLAEQKYRHNTITKNLRVIKTFCVHAAIKGIKVSPDLTTLKTSYETAEKIFLTPDELDRIENTTLFLDHLDNARDWLLISCETAQRVSDFMRFTKDMIRYEKSKDVMKPLLEFTQVKTGKIMTIPLSKRVMKILQKRDGNFPLVITDVKYNLFIKDVCIMAKIDEEIEGALFDPETKRKVTGIYPKHKLVTSHIGRRSFATNNYGIIPTALLIGMTGHATEEQFLEYIGKSDSEKAIHLADYF